MKKEQNVFPFYFPTIKSTKEDLLVIPNDNMKRSLCK